MAAPTALRDLWLFAPPSPTLPQLPESGEREAVFPESTLALGKRKVVLLCVGLGAG